MQLLQSNAIVGKNKLSSRPTHIESMDSTIGFDTTIGVVVRKQWLKAITIDVNSVSRDRSGRSYKLVKSWADKIIRL